MTQKTTTLKYWGIAVSFLLFLFCVAFAGEDKLSTSLVLGGLMVVFWLFELLPIYVTALFPLIFAIPLGLLNKSQLASSYGNTTIMLFLGGFIIALALEKHHVHKQIALRIIQLVGNSKSKLIFGFMVSTALLSMWISNTATTLMILPMALAVIASLPKKKQGSRFSIFLLLSVAYGASVGGMATIIGSPPNGVMQSILLENYSIDMSFSEWMMYGIPLSLLMQLIVFLFFYILLGKERNEAIEFDFEKKKWTISQIRVLILFGSIVLLWTFRSILENVLGINLEDFVLAILVASLLFVIPQKGKKKALLVWKDTKNLPWGVLLLFGGGLALAKMLEVNGVIDEVAKQFATFSEYGLFIVLLIIVSIAIFGTEFISNTALATVFIPIVAQFALHSDFEILQLCVPVTLAASCAFMLPVGTPPNAIVFSSGKLHINQMARYGFLLNIIAVVVIAMSAYFLF